ncbi:GerAB/ArcD/ProY family transporter [Paenibacillus nanensis]|uniref:GerAB/ArcD/ProY family transporter n=1 Tax=Paenibacillus nanensis TaxID=393251 RepID=UPI0013C34721|nr:GerAB/ArcD/ProY family transporter [Paenibacillus nanensis]
MIRYLYYMIIMCMLINIMLNVPTFLIERRYDGAVMGILAAVVSGSLCAVVFIKALRQFPNQGLPEIFRSYLPPAIRVPLLLYLGIMWLIAGLIVLITFSRILQRFLDPDIDILILRIFLILICSFLAAGSSRSILYTAEIVILLHVPFVALLLVKALGHEYMDWEAVKAVGQFVRKTPDLEIISVASYIFTGYINMAVFNRFFRKEDKIRGLWLIPLAGFAVLFTTFFIPIGYHGTEGVASFIYVWVSTADSIRMEFGFVERVIYMFLLIYLSISLLFITMTWHVGAELLKDVFSKKQWAQEDDQRFNWTRWLICLLFSPTCIVTLRFLNEKNYLELTDEWLIVRYISEVALVLIVFWLGRKASK